MSPEPSFLCGGLGPAAPLGHICFPFEQEHLGNLAPVSFHAFDRGSKGYR